MSTTTAITSPTASPALTWATANGTIKTRHTESGAARGNRVARLSQADQATLARMVGGDYSGYMRDVGACLPVGYLKALKSHFSTFAYAQAENLTGKQLIALTGDTPLVNPSKLVMVALAEFMAAPLKEVKKVAAPADLPKSCAWLAELAAAWLANEHATAIAHAANVADVPAGDTVAADTVAADTVAADTVAADTVAADTVAADTVAADTVAADTGTEATEAHEVDLSNLMTA